MTPALLEVNGVTLQYKTPRHLVTATYQVDFNVHQGDRYVILGPSGCGKSTLLKAVGGFMAPVEGMIRIRGNEVRAQSPVPVVRISKLSTCARFITGEEVDPIEVNLPGVGPWRSIDRFNDEGGVTGATAQAPPFNLSAEFVAVQSALAALHHRPNDGDADLDVSVCRP